MAVTVTTLFHGNDMHIVDIEATADGDGIAIVPHGLGIIPVEVVITGLSPKAQLSLWTTTVIDQTNVILIKTAAVGSGGVGKQVRVIIKKLLSTWTLAPLKLQELS